MKLNYKRFGEGEPLIILHGLMGMLDNWQRPAKMLDDDFDVIIVDLRNHGHSPHSEEMNYDLMLEDVIELMDDLGFDSANLLGHSMGGKVVMKLAQKYPERVKKMIVADIGPRYYPVHHDKILKALRAVPLNDIERRTDAESYMEEFIAEPGVRQFLMKSLYQPERNSFAWRFNLDAIESNIEKVGEAMDEAEYDGETLFIRGGNSDYIKDEEWADILLVFPKAYLMEVEGAGHWLHAEKPEEFVEIVKDFLSD